MKMRRQNIVRNQDGLTLIETLVASVILLVGLLTLAQLFGVAIKQNTDSGRDFTKAVALAEDKMEELNNLSFSDTTTNVSVNAPYPPTGKGLSQGGSTPPASTVTYYSDFVDQNGFRTTAADSLFTRQWQISDVSPSLKRIFVSVKRNRPNFGPPLEVKLVTLKAKED